MARVLCIWELGGGTGHVANLAPWVHEAARCGHRVTVAGADPALCASRFAGLEVDIIATPSTARRHQTPETQLLSWTEVILRSLGTEEALATRVATWQELLQQLQPDLVVYEFAPTALIASLQHSSRKWITGNGFTLPRADLPYLGLFPRVRNTPDNARRLAEAESRLLGLVNSVQPVALSRPEQLFSQADEQLLMTLPEIDPFGKRATPAYLGIDSTGAGASPQWLQGKGLKVFGYLQPFPGLQLLLQHLEQRGANVLVHCPGVPTAIRTAFPRINFADHQVDLAQAFEQADLVCTMGNHTTTAQAVLAGTPLLLLPTGLEQFYTARRLVNTGVAVGARADGLQATDIDAALSLAERGRITTNPQQRRLLGGETLTGKVKQLFEELPKKLSPR